MDLIQTEIGAVHTVFALVAMLSGGYVIAKPKGDHQHKISGYVYIVTMLLMNITALFTQTLFVFGPFHYLALFSLGTVVFAISCPLMLRQNTNWLNWHFQAMCWSYVGLWAAFASELIVRLPFVTYGPMFGLMVALASVAVTAIGGYFIVRYKNANQYVSLKQTTHQNE